MADLPPKFREKLADAFTDELRLLLANEAIAESERQFQAAEGERANHDDEKQRCAADIFYWWDRWAWTYDPRLVGKIDPVTRRTMSPYIQFKLWPRQREMVQFVLDRIYAGEPFVIEKSRDQGASYVMVGVALWCWLFLPGFKATFGSREADLVDSLNDPDSIFEKLRLMLDRLPEWMKPRGFDRRRHAIMNQLTNPETGATITGEAGDEMGRGGRATLYIVDEGAFVPRAGKVEAALSGTTDCVGWVSTVNSQEGMGNFFARKRHGMPERLVFRLHWRDDPRKNDEWAAIKKASLTDDITWEAEFEINYTANAAGTCIPALWVRSAQLLAKLLPIETTPHNRTGVTGGDVGGGKALSVVVHRFAPYILTPQVRREPDTIDTAHWMMKACRDAGTSCLNFDAPGIGAGVLSALNHADKSEDPEIREIAQTLTRVAINTGVPGRDDVIWPDDRTSEEMFANLKMELWWIARNFFQRSHWHYLWLTKKEGGRKQLLSEIVILPDSQDRETSAMVTQLSLPLYGRNERGKLALETKEKMRLRGIPSPDHADGCILSFLEPPDDGIPQIKLFADSMHRDSPTALAGIGHGTGTATTSEPEMPDPDARGRKDQMADAVTGEQEQEGAGVNWGYQR